MEGEDYQGANHTELYQLCQSKDISVHPDTSRELMIEYIIGRAEPPEYKNVFDTWRRGLMHFMLDYWSQLRTQLTCPAQDLKTWIYRDHDIPGSPVKRRKGLPLVKVACRTCTDAQVMACVLMNPSSEEQIEQRRE